MAANQTNIKSLDVKPKKEAPPNSLNIQIFSSIEIYSILGQFIAYEDVWMQKHDRIIVLILVKLDFWEGLLIEFEIEWGDWNFLIF